MTAPQEPGPLQRVPEWVGDDDAAVDVSRVSDRQVAVTALDKILRLVRAVGRLTDRFDEFLTADSKSKEILLRELPDHGRRIVTLEVNMQRVMANGSKAPVAASKAAEDEPYRPEESSYHNIHEMMVETGDILYRRMKDPRDGMSSDRVRQIMHAAMDSAKTAEDAASFRKLKKGTKAIALEVVKHFLKWVLPLLVGGGAVHWGVHRGQMPAQERQSPAATQGSR